MAFCWFYGLIVAKLAVILMQVVLFFNKIYRYRVKL